MKIFNLIEDDSSKQLLRSLRDTRKPMKKPPLDEQPATRNPQPATRNSQLFDAVCRAMADPAFYPHPATPLECRETHISTVFLAGEWVYKLKKPVDFGFLDFRTLDAQRYFCEREVVLNQRLSHDVYQRVVDICRDEAGRFFLDGGEPVACAVKMRRLPDEACLAALLRHGAITRGDMEGLGRHLASFYAQGESSNEINHFGNPQVIAFNMEENFQQVEPFVGAFLDRERWEFIREASRAFFHHWHQLFEKRLRHHRIRDGHGDLRAEHVYFYRGIQIIDCIEFNDRFRYGDVASDLAFLHMDLEALGHPEVSRPIMAAYVQYSGDFELYALLDFYATYRALVKVKVACLRSTEIAAPEGRLGSEQMAGEYLDHAYRYALQFSRPTLWVFCGLPASGKSALAERLAEALSLPLFQSDRLRKAEPDHAVPEEEVVPFGEGHYRLSWRQRTYARMLALAQENLKNGHSSILDATFSRSKWREEARQLATDLDTNLIFVECVSGEETLKARLKEREPGHSFSDARLQHLPEMIEAFEPLTEVAADTHIRLDTEQPLATSFLELLAAGYASKCAQVKQVCQRLNSTPC